jgi:hypothetical protein
MANLFEDCAFGDYDRSTGAVEEAEVKWTGNLWLGIRVGRGFDSLAWRGRPICCWCWIFPD